MELRVKMITPQAKHDTGYLTSLSFPIPLFTNTKIGLNLNSHLCPSLHAAAARVFANNHENCNLKPVAKIAKIVIFRDTSDFFVLLCQILSFIKIITQVETQSWIYKICENCQKSGV